MASLASSAALFQRCGYGGLSEMRQSASLAAELEKDSGSPWYALARVGLGFSLYLCGEPAAAATSMEEAVICESPLPLVQMMALSALSLVAVGQGRLLWAEELVRVAGDLTGRGDLSETPQAAGAYMAAGALHGAQGNLDQARNELERALRRGRRVPGVSPWPTLEVLLQLAEVLLGHGDRTAPGTCWMRRRRCWPATRTAPVRSSPGRPGSGRRSRGSPPRRCWSR